MKECYKEFFLLNGEVKSTKDFKNKILDVENAVYEVIRLIDGKPVKAEDHIERMNKSLSAIGYDYAVSKELGVKKIEHLAEINDVKKGNVKCVLLKEGKEYEEILFFIRHHYPTKKELQEGVDVVLLNAKRDNPNIKVINNELRSLANSIIEEENVYEVLLMNELGYVTEGSRSNFFMVKNETVYTSPIDSVLPGTARKRVMDICDNEGIRVIEKNLHYMSLRDYESAFITGTSPGVLPIKDINSFKFNVDNPVMRFIQKEYYKLLE